MKLSDIQAQLNEIKQLLTKQTEKPLNMSEASKHLGMTKSYLYKLTASHKIPHGQPMGKKIYFKKSDLDDWIFKEKQTEMEPENAA